MGRGKRGSGVTERGGRGRGRGGSASPSSPSSQKNTLSSEDAKPEEVLSNVADDDYSPLQPLATSELNVKQETAESNLDSVPSNTDA